MTFLTRQTKRKLNTRINERNNKKLNSSRHSVITKHLLQYNHSFDWKRVRTLDSELNYNKRLIFETLLIKTLLIKKQLNGINLKKDIESLDDVFI